MQRIILILFVSLFFFACGQNEDEKVETENKARIKRENLFASFQKFADTEYPNWKIKGLRKDESETTADGTERNFYYLLLTDGIKEKMVFVIRADFELADGTSETRIHAASNKTLKNLEERQIKEKGVEEYQEKLDSADVDPAEPQV